MPQKDDLRSASPGSSEAVQSTTAAAHAQLTDLEMTKLCAEAAGCTLWLSEVNGDVRYWTGEPGTYAEHTYDPLHDDAQAMALMQRFGTSAQRQCKFKPPYEQQWVVWVDSTKDVLGYHCAADTLNRALVECVAIWWKRQHEARATVAKA